jgi:hypothetical protein
MDSRFSPPQSKVPMHLGAARPALDAMTRSAANSIRPSLGKRASRLGKRASRRLARFLIMFGIGVGATLAWQSYGDAARAMIANSSPQLGWFAPQTAPIARTTPDVVAPAAPGTASADVQQLALGLASMRQSVDQLGAELAAGQRQVAGDIARLQVDEQEILQKLSATPPRSAAVPARKPASVTAPPAPAVQAR